MPFDGFMTAKPKPEPITLDSFRKEDKPYLIVSYGVGRDSIQEFNEATRRQK